MSKPVPCPSHSPPSQRGSKTATTGEDLMKWFEKLFGALTAVAAVGAGFTFSVIVTGLDDPPKGARFDKDWARWLLALSWFLFILTIGVTTIAQALFSFQEKRLVDGYDGAKGRSGVAVLFAIISLLMQGLIIAAFMASALAVSAYVQSIGWTAVGFTAVFGLIALGLWGYMSCGAFSEERTPTKQSSCPQTTPLPP